MPKPPANQPGAQDLQTADRRRGPQQAMRRFFMSNATRQQLPANLVKRLDEIRMSGVGLFNALQPYEGASVFRLQFNEGSYSRGAREGATKRVMEMFRITAEHTRKALDRASKEFMPKAFAKHKAEDKDMETTEAISAFFFLAALSKYGADVILESVDDPKDKKKLAREFVSFYDKKVKGFMDLETKLRMKPQKFHESVFAVYNEFKQEFPELFDDLRERLWTSQGELMASYGSPRFAHSWIDQHYMGRL